MTTPTTPATSDASAAPGADADGTVRRTVTVGSSVGLHARPAAMVAEAAGAQPAVVKLSTGGDPVDARSLLSILALGASHGTAVTVEATGEGAQASVDALADLIASDLDQEG